MMLAFFFNVMFFYDFDFIDIDCHSHLVQHGNIGAFTLFVMEIRCSGVQCSGMRCSAMQYSAVQCIAMQCSAAQ